MNGDSGSSLDRTRIGPVADEYGAIMVGVSDAPFFIQAGTLEVSVLERPVRHQE